MRKLIAAGVAALSLQGPAASADQWIGTDFLGTVSARTIIPLDEGIVQFIFDCSEAEQFGKFITATLSYNEADFKGIRFGDRRFAGLGMVFSYNFGDEESAIASNGSEFGWPRHAYALRVTEGTIFSLIDPGRSLNLAQQLAAAFLNAQSVDINLITAATDVSTDRDISETGETIELQMDGFAENIAPVFAACEIDLPAVSTIDPQPQNTAQKVRTFSRDAWTMANTLLGPSAGIREAGVNGPDTSVLTLACDYDDRFLTRLRMDYAVPISLEDSTAEIIRVFPVFFNASGIVPIDTAPIGSILSLLKSGKNEYLFVFDAEERDLFHQALARYRSVQFIVLDSETDNENWQRTSKAIEFLLRGSSAAIASIRERCLN